MQLRKAWQLHLVPAWNGSLGSRLSTPCGRRSPSPCSSPCFVCFWPFARVLEVRAVSLSRNDYLLVGFSSDEPPSRITAGRGVPPPPLATPPLVTRAGHPH